MVGIEGVLDAAGQRGVRGRLPQLRGLSALLRRQRDVPEAKALHRLLFPRDYLAEVDLDALDELMRRDFVPAPLKSRLSQAAAVMRHNTRARLAELGDVPTLVVKAPHDVLVDPDQSDVLARGIPGARLVEMPDVGHGLLRQQPRELLAVLSEHILRVDQGALRG